MKLTGHEKQEIIRHIEADKPLPEKYRFTLFGDKRGDKRIKECLTPPFNKV